MSKSLKTSLIISGSLALILLGLSFIPLPAAAQTSVEHTGEANDTACMNWCKARGYTTWLFGNRPKGSCLCGGGSPTPVTLATPATLPTSAIYGDALDNSGSIKHCASFSGGTPDQWNRLGDKYCIFDNKDITNWNQYSTIGLSINQIKIPYSVAGPNGIWGVIKSVQFTNSDYGSSNCNELLENWSNLKIAKTYDDVKTAIIRSCLPGSITTAKQGYTLRCEYEPGCHKCWVFYKCCNDNTVIISNYNPDNYPSWSTPGCGPLSKSMNIAVSKAATISDDYHNGRIELEVGEPFTLSWSLSNPSATCEVWGFDANNSNSTNALIQKITPDKVGIAVRTGAITPKTGQTVYGNPQKGIYKYTFSCNGVINGTDSPVISREGIAQNLIPEISRTVYVGDIPPDPVVTFNLVQPNENLIPASEGSSYQYGILLNQTFQLGWNATNLDKIEKTDSLPIIIKHLEKSSGVTSILSSSKNTNSKTSPIKLTSLGTHEFYLEATNPDFPELKSVSPQPIIIRVKLATTSNAVTVDFSADKTEIKMGESAELSWDASGAAKVTIDQGIGSVAKFGKTTVYPTSATTYTLTAKSPIVNVPDTKKVVTINIKGEEVIPVAIEPFDISSTTATNLPEQEGKPTNDKIDLKVNGTDGPVTLSAPAKFALSWNLNTYCLATGSWLDVKTQAGSQSITLNKNGKYTYSLYCPGYGTDSVVVEVVNSDVNGLLNAALGNESETTSMPVAETLVSTDGSTYSQDIKVIKGKATDIYIKIDKDINGDGFTSRDASGIWSDLMTNGGYCLYNNDLVKGTPSFSGMIASPADAQTCNTKLGTFTFNDEPGTYKYGVFRMLQNDQKLSNISYMNITVENPPAPTSGPVIDLKINGNDAVEQILGTPANFDVSWNVINANSCEAFGSWSGSKDMNGTQSFVSSSKKNFIYTLTCIGALGTNTKSINLKVAEAPACSFTALPPSINKQSSFITESELSWKCDYADACNLSPNVNTAIKTYGSLRVSPDQTTTYILTCNNSDISKPFEAKVEVK